MVKPNVPQLADFPEYQAEQKRLSEINVALRGVREELVELRANRPTVGGADAVDALISGAELTAGQSPSEWRSRIHHLVERESLLTEASRVQVRRVREARERVGAQIADQVAPEYRALQARMAAAVQALGELADEEAALRAEIEARGVPSSQLRPNQLDWMRLRGPNPTRANTFLENAARDHGVKVRR